MNNSKIKNMSIVYKKEYLFFVFLLVSVAMHGMSGSGTKEDPFLVATANDLNSVRDNLSAYYKQICDIDLSSFIALNNPEEGWEPIGIFIDISQQFPFEGEYDGNNKAITGLYINRPNTVTVGLFGWVYGGELKNICIINPRITGNVFVGALVGELDEREGGSTISGNSILGGYINGEGSVGGLAGVIGQGYRTGGITIANNIVQTNITGRDNSGGICGLISEPDNNSYYFRFLDNYFFGGVNGHNYVGGIIGYGQVSFSTEYVQHLVMERNIVIGSVHGVENTNGLYGNNRFVFSGSISHNFCLLDSLSVSSSTPYCIADVDDNFLEDNYTLSSIVVKANGSNESVSSSKKNGTLTDSSLLKQKEIYVSNGFDFENTWNMIEGETYPFNIGQTLAPTITNITYENEASISGTSAGDGTVYVIIGEEMYKGTIENGKWKVMIQAAKKGTVAKVLAHVNGLKPSAIVEVIIEKEIKDDLQEYLNSLAYDTEDVVGGNIYQREFLNTDWQSLFVPFSMSYSDWQENFEVAKINSSIESDDDGDYHADSRVLVAVVVGENDDALLPNYPYLIRAKKAGTYRLAIDASKWVNKEEKTIELFAGYSKYTFIGNYSNLTGLYSANRYRLVGGALSIPSSDNEVLPPYRWSLTIDNYSGDDVDPNSDWPEFGRSYGDGLADVDGVRIYVCEEETTGLGNRVSKNAYTADARVFNLSGQLIGTDTDFRSGSLPKGVYIMNNKKYVIK